MPSDPPPREPDFVLTPEDLRAVAAFTYAAAALVIDEFEAAAPGDERPRAALDAASLTAAGERRSRLQRVTALASHRAAKDVSGAGWHAAMACGDAAASVYLHPLADAAQVGHILRGPGHAVLALATRDRDPVPREKAIATVLELATPGVVDVLRRYPPAAIPGRGEVTAVVTELDTALRGS